MSHCHVMEVETDACALRSFYGREYNPKGKGKSTTRTDRGQMIRQTD